ncbi:MAG: hypothetical protein AAF664_01990 [Planctomycetota bacterium]
MSLLNLIRSLVGGKKTAKPKVAEASVRLSVGEGSSSKAAQPANQQKKKRKKTSSQKRGAAAAVQSPRAADSIATETIKPRRAGKTIPKTPLTKILRKQLQTPTADDFVVVQIGLDDGSVASETSALLAANADVRVVIIDPFDGPDANRSLMSLHRSFRASGVNGQIMPGEVEPSLEKAIRDLGAVDLLVVLRDDLLAGTDADRISRLVHSETLVIQRQGANFEVAKIAVAGHRAVRRKAA